jgi:hypothetical protein
MQVLGDMMNIPLCGMNPTYLTAMCFDSISAITVKYLFLLLTVTACYIPQKVSGFTSFFSSEHNRNISIFNIKKKKKKKISRDFTLTSGGSATIFYSQLSCITFLVQN